MSELLEKYINEHKDEWYAQGKADGLAEAREEGRIEGATNIARQIALSLVQNGFAVELIAKSTGLSVDEVNRLKESCKD